MSQSQQHAPLPSRFGIRMAGIGAYVPQATVTNDDLTQLVETSDEWIASRTGIRERHVVSGDQTVGELAIAAAKDALASAGIDGSEIDLIIVGTSTPDTIYPAVACQVQHAIGATNAAGFDLSLACSGFVYANVVAQQFLMSGMFKKALIMGADIHSRVVDWEDRNTCVLFGDGAGAAVLVAEEGAPNTFYANDLHLDGGKGPELTLYTDFNNCPLVEERSERTKTDKLLYMNGREMFKFAVGVVPSSIRTSLEQANMTLDDIDYVVLHQANIRIMQAMSERLNIPEEKLLTHIAPVGNTSAASIPIALNHAVRTGKVKAGQKLLLCGFGAGAAWGSTIVEWTAVDQRTPLQGDVTTAATQPAGQDLGINADSKEPVLA